jgi:uncharacterized protein with von Willebrand factor type A (vWA) domain
VTDAPASLQGFVAQLRDEGMEVGLARTLAFCEAAVLLEPTDLYFAGSATLVSRAEEIPVFDAVFRRYWGRAPSPAQPDPPHVSIPVGDQGPGFNGGPIGRAVRHGSDPREPSAIEVLRHKDLAEMEDRDLAIAVAYLRRIMRPMPSRPSRRRRRGRTGALDVRRTVAQWMRHPGAADELLWRAHRTRPRRLVLLLDVSGSMAGYARAWLALGRAGMTSRGRCEVFCFATRLTRVTRELARARTIGQLQGVADVVVDWDGGTRIGDSLKRFIDRYGHAGMARGAVVVICSDGLEVGSPQLLGEQMQRLGRLAHRIIWLNPLKRQAGYEPLAQGMAAAFPHTDKFLSGHSLASISELTEALA